MVDIQSVPPAPPTPPPVPAPRPAPAPVVVGFPRRAGNDAPPVPLNRDGVDLPPVRKKSADPPVQRPKTQPATYSRYGIHGPSGMFFVRVMDAGSGRAVKTLPPAWILEVHARLREASGRAVDEEA